MKKNSRHDHQGSLDIIPPPYTPFPKRTTYQVNTSTHKPPSNSLLCRLKLRQQRVTRQPQQSVPPLAVSEQSVCKQYGYLRTLIPPSVINPLVLPWPGVSESTKYQSLLHHSPYHVPPLCCLGGCAICTESSLLYRYHPESIIDVTPPHHKPPQVIYSYRTRNVLFIFPIVPLSPRIDNRCHSPPPQKSTQVINKTRNVLFIAAVRYIPPCGKIPPQVIKKRKCRPGWFISPNMV